MPESGSHLVKLKEDLRLRDNWSAWVCAGVLMCGCDGVCVCVCPCIGMLVCGCVGVGIFVKGCVCD